MPLAKRSLKKSPRSSTPEALSPESMDVVEERPREGRLLNLRIGLRWSTSIVSHARRIVPGIPALEMKALAATTAVLLAACASGPRNPVFDTYPAGVTGRTTVIYYDVQGRTFEEVLNAMRQAAPKVSGTRFFAETRSPMRWTWRLEPLATSTCSIRDVTVSVNAEIILPRWTPPPDAEKGLVTEWNRFINALELHEAGHKDISAKAGREIVIQLRNLSGFCSQIGLRANETAGVILARASEEQRLYDAATRHGFTQGAFFGAGRRPAEAPDSLPSGPGKQK